MSSLDLIALHVKAFYFQITEKKHFLFLKALRL